MIFKRCWEREKTDALFKTERDKNMKAIHKFDHEPQKKWTLFLRRSSERLKWSQGLIQALQETLTKADQCWSEIRQSALEFWQDKEDEVVKILNLKHHQTTQAKEQTEARLKAQQGDFANLATEYAEARAAQSEAERQKQLAEEKCIGKDKEISHLQSELQRLQEKYNHELEMRSAGIANYPASENGTSSNEPLLRADP